MDKFRQIAEQLITREYLGIDEYGKDPEYERELTEASADSLYNIFNNPTDIGGAKSKVVAIFSRKDVKHKSKILQLILHPLS